MNIEFTIDELKAIEFAVGLDLDTLQKMPIKDLTRQNKKEKKLLLRILEKIEEHKND